MKKRVLTLLLTATMLVGTLAGCGSAETAEQDAVAPVETQEKAADAGANVEAVENA